MTRLGLLICAFVAPGLLGACHYSEEAKWRACCFMSIAKDDRSTSAKTIIDFQSRTNFTVTGEALGPIDDKAILTAMNTFLASHPKDGPGSYFLELGMTCKPMAPTTVDVARCEIDLPIRVDCFSMDPPWGAPIPDELQTPIPARLHWQVDVSRSALLGGSARILPTPGGRLCHR